MWGAVSFAFAAWHMGTIGEKTSLKLFTWAGYGSLLVFLDVSQYWDWSL